MSDEPFLSRWSRRKAAERRGEPEPETAPPAEPAPAVVPEVSPPEPTPEAPPPLTLEDAAKLTPSDDFAPFVAHGVDETVKRAALKKLFADPHFNVMDGLDTYIDDYSQPDPIPPEMLRELRHTAGLRLFEPLEEDVATPTGIEPVSDASPASPAVTGEIPREPADAESPLLDDPAQATPHGGAKPPSVE
ncbi:MULTISPECIES: DUF3306 domain-containing protein [Ralstonia]|uniref:DUF3306 domain-containing protein n=1 Tax=Ralstonia mojiangensis TaxID=2953895 RepID=A0AAE3LCS0_9RALS|nr:DUF3306 domain-containing protein [Ralstonia mojiangensis]MCO5410559.1 DUF3306 domain-containing protein [Ralstonia mojiangensis]MCT7294999.1 DUF3306 domain-containing protein [Ralstonia mojiangensis]MCT7313206.1 DUF3306 domain-containing protein [Ralstonia mojiangensis]MCT7315846.1 DUF3306 domain-containing protein [Ralstonia mojiangensis]MCT7324976.1 DUF3306 domain-containing protein [Ralstonia mojiangensis]